MAKATTLYRYQIGILIVLLFPIHLCAQYNTPHTYTPQGSEVPIGYRTEIYTEAEKLSQKEYVLKHYPRTYYVDEATSTYNCHAFAWRNSNSDIYWLNHPNEDLFWLDNSYIEVPFYDSKATRVSYQDDDHSARCYEDGYLISKWGALPLMRHLPEDSPYTYGGLKYYKLSMEIIGDKIINLSGQINPVTKEYALTNVPKGASVEWETDKKIISGQGTNKILVEINGNATIRTIVHCPTGMNITIPSLNVLASRAPIITDITVSKYDGPKGFYILQVITNQPEATYLWETGGNSKLSDIPHKDDASFAEQPNTFKAITFKDYGCYVTVTGTNAAGYSSTFSKFLNAPEIDDTETHP